VLTRIWYSPKKNPNQYRATEVLVDAVSQLSLKLWQINENFSFFVNQIQSVSNSYVMSCIPAACRLLHILRTATPNTWLP